MNTIYRLVWNKARHCFVVSSELARARSKTGRTVGALAVLLASAGVCPVAFGETAADESCERLEAEGLLLEADKDECRITQSIKRSIMLPAAVSAEHIAMDTTGLSAKADGMQAMAFGTEAKAQADFALAIGNTTLANASNTIALGNGATATAVGGIAIGLNAIVAREEDNVGGTGSTHGIAIGFDAKVAMADGSTTPAEAAVAIGKGARAAGKNSIALGAGSFAEEADTVAVGGRLMRRRIVLAADGVDNTDVATVGQLGASVNALGGGASLDKGVFVAPSYNVGGTTFDNVGGAIKALDTAIASFEPGEGGGPGLVIDNGTAVSVAASSNSAILSVAGAAGDRTVTGVADGIAANDAANIAQLTATNASVAELDTALGETNVAVENVASNLTDGLNNANATVATLSTRLDATDLQVGQLSDELVDLTGRVDGIVTGTPGDGLVEQDASGSISIGKGGTGGVLSVAGASDRIVRGVARGTEDNDAVNVAQWSETDVRVTGLDTVLTAATGDITELAANVTSVVGSLGGGASLAGGVYTAPSYSVQANDFSSVGDAIGAIDGELTATKHRVETLENGIPGGNDLIAVTNGAVTIGATSAATGISVAGPGDVARVISGVADGLVANDAVNMGQLSATNTNVTNLGAELGKTNVAVGKLSDDIDDLAERFDQFVPGTPGDGLVQQDGEGNLSIGAGGNGGMVSMAGAADRIVRGVAAGTQDNDAVNLGQVAQIRDALKGDIAVLDERVTAVETSAPVVGPGPAPGPQPGDGNYVSAQQLQDQVDAGREYVDGRFDEVGHAMAGLRGDVDTRFKQMDRRIDRMAATSGAYAGMAMNTAGLEGPNRVGVGVGAQRGEKAIAIGYQHVIGKRASFSVGGATSGSDRSMTAGAGFSW